MSDLIEIRECVWRLRDAWNQLLLRIDVDEEDFERVDQVIADLGNRLINLTGGFDE